jgi:hypothetical protein
MFGIPLRFFVKKYFSYYIFWVGGAIWGAVQFLLVQAVVLMRPDQMPISRLEFLGCWGWGHLALFGSWS